MQAIQKREIRNKGTQSWRHVITWICLIVCLVTLASAFPAKAATTSVQWKKKLTLARYQKVKLTIKNASGTITWSTSNSKVATVTRHGIVRAKNAGKCRIVARTAGKKYVCRLTVNPLAFTKDTVKIVRGRQTTLTLNSPDVTPTLLSSDPEVAAIDRNGVLQSKKPGKCIITAVYNKEKLTCKVEVTEISPEQVLACYAHDESNSGKIVLAGSSSMDFWSSAPQAFSPYQVINMAIGGTSVVQWLTWYQEMIVDYHPAAVVLYVGSNDLANGELITGEQNASNTIRLLKRLKKRLRKIPIFYVGISPCWSRKGAWEKIAVSNALVREFCSQYQYLYYIDIASACAMADGTPDKNLFLSDQLHPNAAGYAVWKRVVAKQVKKVVNKVAKATAKR